LAWQIKGKKEKEKKEKRRKKKRCGSFKKWNACGIGHFGF
jgi:hypothetical protein